MQGQQIIASDNKFKVNALIYDQGMEDAWPRRAIKSNYDDENQWVTLFPDPDLKRIC